MTNNINGTITAGIVITSGGAYTSPLTIGASGAVEGSGTTAAIGAAIGATVVNQGTVGSALPTYGVAFTAGGGVNNNNFFTYPANLTGAHLNHALIEAGQTGVRISGSAGTVVNTGKIVSTGANGSGVSLTAGGTVNNNGVGIHYFTSGATFTLKYATYVGTISAASGVVVTGASGTVTNVGVIQASYASGKGVSLGAGGYVNNSIFSYSYAPAPHSGSYGAFEVEHLGTIQASGKYAAAVDIAGGAGTVHNNGQINANGLAGVGVYLEDGGTVNAGRGLFGGGVGHWTFVSSATIQGGDIGVKIVGAGSVTNGGVISGTGGPGVLLAGGGSVDNLGGYTSSYFTYPPPGHYGASVTITAQPGTISGIDGVRITTGAGTVTNTGTIIGSTRDGVYLAAGGSVNNNTLSAMIGGAQRGVHVSGGAGAVANSGTIESTGGIAISVDGGAGTVTNSGTIESAGSVVISLNAGGRVGNYAFGGFRSAAKQGTVAGANGVEIAGSAGTVLNTGLISAADTHGDAVSFGAGGYFNNGVYNFPADGDVPIPSAIGTVQAAGTYGVAVDMAGAAGAVVNNGSIIANGNDGDGVVLQGGGTVTNGRGLLARPHGNYATDFTLVSSAIIQAGSFGVVVSGGVGVVNNSSAIIASIGSGVQLQAGGSVYNAPGYIHVNHFYDAKYNTPFTLTSVATAGVISGVDGVDITGGVGTVVNAGTIKGHLGAGNGIFLLSGGTVVESGAITGGTAIYFGAGNSLLELVPGYSIYGNIVTKGSGNQLGLGGTAAATLSGLPGRFAGFSTLVAEAGSNWTLTGKNQLSGGVIEGSGTLINAGTLSAASGIALASAVGLNNTGLISGPVTMTGGAVLQNAGSIGGSVTMGGADLINTGTVGGAVTMTGGGTLQNSGSVSGAVTVAGASVVDNAGVLGSGVTISGSQLTNESTGTILSSGVAVMATGGVTITDAGSISGGVGSFAIYLGGTGNNLLKFVPGAAVSGYVVNNGTNDSIELTSGASSGTLTGFGDTIYGFSTISVDAGANWTIGGSFSSGIRIGANSTVDFTAGSTVTATGNAVFGGPGSVINNGAIKANGRGVSLNGGSLNNATASASISGIIDGVRLYGVGGGTVTNVGTITSTANNGVGVTLGAGVVNNSGSSALISGNRIGVYSQGGIATVINAGTILAAGTAGLSAYAAGVFLRSGGTVRDTGTIITGGTDAIEISGTGNNRLELGAGYYLGGGIYVYGTSNSFALLSGTASGSHVPLSSFSAITVDSGAMLTLVGTQNTIVSGDTLAVSGTIGGATAVTLEGGNLLALGPGYSLPAFIAEGTGNRLEFVSGGAGTLTNFTGHFTNFSSITFDPGSSWTIADAETIGGTPISGTFTAISTITNQTTIGGIKLSGGVLNNQTGASVGTVFSSGVVNNYGSIDFINVIGGTVNNHALINNVFLNGTLNNFATLSSIVDVHSTNRINNAGLIRGGAYGVSLEGTLVNIGTIEATSTYGIGVELQSHATLIDAGTISGIKYAVSLSQLGGDLLRLENGYKLIGGVLIAGSASNTIELSNALGAVGFHYDFNYYTLNLRSSTIAFSNSTTAAVTLYDSKSGISNVHIQGFTAGGDKIDLTAVSDSSGTASYQVNGSNVTVTGDGGSYAVLKLTELPTKFKVQNDGFGHAELLAAPCFAEGTRIRTPRGQVAVEDLREGDEVVTVSGRRVPICWIGHRRVDCRRHPEPERVWPVRIAPHAFGQGRPRREVLLSPDHSVFVEGVLIPIKFLTNDVTVKQMQVDRVRYFHIELARHDVVLAEGLPAESYLETGSRASFENAAAVTRLHADFAPDDAVVGEIWHAQGYAPLLGGNGELERARRMLALQAILLTKPRQKRTRRTALRRAS